MNRRDGAETASLCEDEGPLAGGEPTETVAPNGTLPSTMHFEQANRATGRLVTTGEVGASGASDSELTTGRFDGQDGQDGHGGEDGHGGKGGQGGQDGRGDQPWFELWNVQQGLWLQHQLGESRADSNLPLWQHLHETLDLAAFRKAVSFLVDRHQALRLSFQDTADGPRQRVLPVHDLDVPLVDLTGLADPEAEVDRLIRIESATPFDDLGSPPVRVKIYRLASDHHCVFVNVHHIIADGTSMGILLRELLLCHRAFAAGEEPPLAPLPKTFEAFVQDRQQWLSGTQSKSMETYWLDQLAAPLPRLRIGDYEAPADDVVNETLEFWVEADITEGLGALAKELHVTLHILLLSAFVVALRDISSDDDIVVCVPFFGRDTKDLEGMVGNFVNPLSVRMKMSGSDAFDDVVRRARSASIGSYANSRYPFTRLLEQVDAEARPGRNPFFSSAFQFTRFLPPAKQTSQLDLCLYGRPDGERIKLRFNYNSRRLAESEIREVQSCFQAVLRRILGDAAISLDSLSEPLRQARRTMRAAPRDGRRLGRLRGSRSTTPDA
ncbi:condensation domain-containing protein [Streptomyces mutomycini]|uniref:Condensation domain-containing protein n=1 Tax=Streptomyces mutomycini TaxID=284036 RepID=A0ABW0B4F6_9ACTN|nr:condensation domain-containing protein [Streptomyces mutomycini]